MSSHPALRARAPASPRSSRGDHGDHDEHRDHAALAALGDAVAVLDRDSDAIAWTSDAWRTMHPALADGTTLAALRRAWPGLPELDEAAAAAPLTCTVGEGRRWALRIGRLDAHRLVLRSNDRRPMNRALQRHLDDREQLMVTSRAVSVGEMAATLAHELNQPIGAASNLLRGLRMRTARRPGALADDEMAALERAIEQLAFGARIVARIREHTPSRASRHERLDLAALARASVALLDWDLQRAGVRVELDAGSATAPVLGDATMLQQVMVNLVRNALDALRADPPDEPRIALRLLAGADRVELRIADNGCGLDAQAEANLFVPFASSKPSGTGIGLLICRSFVEQHQGRLWFSRNAGRGTTFHLELPRSRT